MGSVLLGMALGAIAIIAIVLGTIYFAIRSVGGDIDKNSEDQDTTKQIEKWREGE